MVATDLRRPRGQDAAERPASSFRLDVQGLRAIAVLAVIVDHLIGVPTGGFVGVDVFFVISGFLITNLLLREYERTGRISLADFYRRRVRRIMPVALLVLVVTSAATWLVFSTVRAADVALDALWAALFAANWRFVWTGTDYARADGLVSPLQHYWSLSVEEQFYFVWPFVMIAVIAATLALDRRSGRPIGRSVRVPLGIAVGVLSAASVIWAFQETQTAPTSAYFSTFSRAWELGVGAALAIAAPLFARLPVGVRPVLSWAGLVGIGVSFLVLSGESAFPAPWALLPVLSAGLVIAAGVGGTPRHVGILTNRVSTYLGDISYSLYLWHWPVIVLLPAFLPDRGVLFYLAASALTLAVSVLSFHLVEDPIRRSAWLDPGRKDRTVDWRDRMHGLDPEGNLRMIAGGVVLALVTVVTIPVIFPQSPAPGVRADGPASSSVAGGSAADPGDAAAALAEEVAAALEETEFPAELVPALDRLDTRTWFSEVTTPDCLNIASTEQSIACETGPIDSGKDVVILGDSFGIAWTPGIIAALEPLGWRIHPLTRGQCPASETSVTQAGGEAFPGCDATHEWRKERIAEIRPELTIISQAHTTAGRLASEATGRAAAEELATGLRSTVDAITPHTEAILVFAPPPTGTSLQECVTNVGSPEDCISGPDRQWRQVTDAEASALTGSTATYLDTRDWFCSEGRCPGIVGDTAVRVDIAHLSIPYARKLAPVIAQAVERVTDA